MHVLQIIQDYLVKHIPITKALAITVELDDDHNIMVSAPLKNNINHKMTAFGGSLHAVATLACWSFLYQQFIEQLEKIEIVISHSEIDYLLPVICDFKAICYQPENDTWAKFHKILTKKDKARIVLKANILQDNQLAVAYQGTFVVMVRKLSNS